MKKTEKLFSKPSEKAFILSAEKLAAADAISVDALVAQKASEQETIAESNSRCVSVDTKYIAPPGRNKKKKMFKAKTALVKFRCSLYEKKLLLVKAKNSGLSLSEYCRRVATEKNISERLSDDHIEIYQMLLKYHNNFKSIGNMFRRKDPGLSEKVKEIASEIKLHLKRIKG